jgi:glucose-1-phosphate thymidylyltransferase
MAGGAEVSVAVVDATQPAGTRVDGLGHWSIYETTIGNLPLIGLVCEEIAAAGVRTARIVTPASTRRELGRMIGGGDAWGMKISYVDVPDDDSQTVLLQELDRALETAGVILHPGDCLLRRALPAMAQRYGDGDVDAVIAASPPAPQESTPHPRLSAAPLVLGAQVRDVVRRLISSAERHAPLDLALMGSDLRLARCAAAETWIYSGSTEALLAGNRMVLDALEGEDLSPHADGNRLQGRIRISPSATVRNSVIVGPVSIGEHAVVEDSYIGPFTAIANDAVISGTEIDNTIVLAGAELRHPGSRIEGSVIGAGASISQSFGLPRGMHLRLAAGSHLTVS